MTDSASTTETTEATHNGSAETILFGAFDRHNFGDMLFPHVLARMLPGRRLRFAGLLERDLRAYGGHFVEAIPTLAASGRDQATDIVHVGGELLTCDAWEAAVMLSNAAQAASVIDEHPAWLHAPLDWASEHLGIRACAPYIVSKTNVPWARRILFNAIGGTDLVHCTPSMHAEVVEALRGAEDVTVRDLLTQEMLGAAGIAAHLLPDPAVMVAELFDDVIRHRADNEALSSIRDACPNGYVAVQFSADFGDDRTLDTIAAQLDVLAALHGFGIAFFRAGIAPWHDALAVYERTRRRMRAPSVHIMTSPNIWDVCALIAGCQAYCGSSLHGRIVATAYALPRINVRHPTPLDGPSKQTAFAGTWERIDLPGEVGVADIVRGVNDALHVEPDRLRHIAQSLTNTYRSGFERVAARLA